MGVDTHYYAYYGVKSGFDEKLSELYDDVTEVADDASGLVLFDGMGGDYMILGCMLFDSGSQRWGEVEDTFKSIPLESLPQIEADYRAKFAKYFPEFKHLIDGKKFELMVFAHYT